MTIDLGSTVKFGIGNPRQEPVQLFRVLLPVYPLIQPAESLVTRGCRIEVSAYKRRCGGAVLVVMRRPVVYAVSVAGYFNVLPVR